MRIGSLHVHFIAPGYAADGADAAGETDGATGRAHMEVLYLLPDVCIITITTYWDDHFMVWPRCKILAAATAGAPVA